MWGLPRPTNWLFPATCPHRSRRRCGYACGAFALVELFDYINGKPPKDREVLIPLVAVTKDNATKYQDQVLNGMDTYDFKAVSQVYTPGASTDDYGITLK